MRRVLISGVMIVGITLMLWAGWHNLQERKRTMQRVRDQQVTLIPEKSGGESAGEMPTMRGKTAPAFTLATLDGKKVSLADYKGRPVLVNFWATWCGPCKVEMPWFEQFRKQYAAQGFEILGLTDDYDAGKETISKVVVKAGVTYPILLTDGKVQTAYGGFDVLPVSFYIDRNGVIVLQTAGLGSRDQIDANIRQIIASGGTQAGGM